MREKVTCTRLEDELRASVCADTFCPTIKRRRRINRGKDQTLNQHQKVHYANRSELRPALPTMPINRAITWKTFPSMQPSQPLNQVAQVLFWLVQQLVTNAQIVRVDIDANHLPCRSGKNCKTKREKTLSRFWSSIWPPVRLGRT